MTKSIQRVAKQAIREDTRARDKVAAQRTVDGMENFAAAIGIGTDNLLSSTSYGFNPISRIRTLLEWIHRGSWLGGVAIDTVADDMTRAGITLKGEIEPTDIEEINEEATSLGIWNAFNDTIKWGRLYGGGLGVLLIDGQDIATPLNIDTVGKKQFRGVLSLDRWMVEPALQDLITELGPDLGMPKYYRVTAQAPALVMKRIHHTRCTRIEGIRLPYWQRLQENLWGISVIERLYDRMVAVDSGTLGVAQLLNKAYLRTYKIDGLREIIAAGGPAYKGLIKMVEMMRRMQTNEGITLLDGKDEFEATQNTTFSGSDDALLMLLQQVAGALQIPLVRLLGQSPAGLNSTGESDLRTYYDGINQQQNRYLKGGVTKVYRCIAQSLGKKVPKGFSIDFKPLWQLTAELKADVATKNTATILSAQQAGLVSDQVALKELKQQSDVSGIWTNITNEDIESASDVPAPPVPEEGEGGNAGGEES